MGKILGIDYGKKKVGLALSEGELASGLDVLEVNSLIDARNKVFQVIEKLGIELVVLGMPESGESKKMAEKFLEELTKNGVNVEIVEETLSTKRALEEMIESGSSQKMRKKEDSIAAAIILQDYLDTKR